MPLMLLFCQILKYLKELDKINIGLSVLKVILDSVRRLMITFRLARFEVREISLKHCVLKPGLKV